MESKQVSHFSSIPLSFCFCLAEHLRGLMYINDFEQQFRIGISSRRKKLWFPPLFSSCLKPQCNPRPNNLSLSHNFVATMYEWRHDYFSKSLVLKWLLSAMRMMRIWQRLWLSWQSIRFRHQRLTVRIQSSAKLYIEHLLTVNCIEQTKIKKMRPGVALLKEVDLSIEV